MTSDAFLADPTRACNPDLVDPNDRYAWTSDYNPDKVQAKRHCLACPVQTACLAYALHRGERYGIWGGVDMADTRHRDAAQRGERSTSDRVLELWKAGLYNHVIAALVGIHPDTVRDHLNRLGLRSNGRPGPKARQAVAA